MASVAGALPPASCSQLPWGIEIALLKCCQRHELEEFSPPGSLPWKLLYIYSFSCFHQFTPLSELVAMGKEPLLELLRRYSSYTAHVRRTIYADPKKWEEEERMELEDQWPEYKESSLMVSRPSYQQQDDATMDADSWRREFLDTDVEALQKHKQHHVHLPTGTH